MLFPISLGKDEIERLSVEKHKNGYWLGVKLIVNPLMVMVSRPLATAAAFQERFHVNTSKYYQPGFKTYKYKVLTVKPSKYFDFWSIMMHNGIPRSGTNCPSKSRVGVPITRQFRFWNKSTDLPNLPATSKVTCHGQSTGRLVCPETCVLLLPFLLGPQPHRRVRTDI